MIELAATVERLVAILVDVLPLKPSDLSILRFLLHLLCYLHSGA